MYKVLCFTSSKLKCSLRKKKQDERKLLSSMHSSGNNYVEIVVVLSFKE